MPQCVVENVIPRIVILLLGVTCLVLISVLCIPPCLNLVGAEFIGGIILLGLFYVSMCIWFWCYVELEWRDSGRTETYLRDHGVLEQIRSGSIPEQYIEFQLCKTCGLPKPIKTHHCSTCKGCVFRMDHHCGALGKCIGLHNYKHFVLFSMYNALTLFIVGGIIGIITKSALALIAPLFALVFIIFGIHYILPVRTNTTTIDKLNGNHLEDNLREPSFYIREVFGKRWFDFILPTRSYGDGFFSGVG